mmetsp:Transcript_31359/g.95896  ORF Transcript_31359/g.95896 Transcript_31359/m.95896 type:complete len:245 (-) Transcript_31359:255-989(-)
MKQHQRLRRPRPRRRRPSQRLLRTGGRSAKRASRPILTLTLGERVARACGPPRTPRVGVVPRHPRKVSNVVPEATGEMPAVIRPPQLAHLAGSVQACRPPRPWAQERRSMASPSRVAWPTRWGSAIRRRRFLMTSMTMSSPALRSPPQSASMRGSRRRQPRSKLLRCRAKLTQSGHHARSHSSHSLPAPRSPLIQAHFSRHRPSREHPDLRVERPCCHFASQHHRLRGQGCLPLTRAVRRRLCV